MWSLNKLAKKIYLLELGDSYELAMTFLRVQEFYESSNPKFRNHMFSLLDFIEWYSKEFGEGSFTYPVDWAGFNVPGEVINNLLYNHYPDDDNKYDKFIFAINDLIKSDQSNDDGKYYLIGAVRGDKDTIEHELAHAMYNTIEAYKFNVNTTKRNEKMFLAVKEYLLNNGYTSAVVTDEYQAYMATGLIKDIVDCLKGKNFKDKDIKKEQEIYKALFKSYRNNLDG